MLRHLSARGSRPRTAESDLLCALSSTLCPRPRPAEKKIKSRDISVPATMGGWLTTGDVLRQPAARRGGQPRAGGTHRPARPRAAASLRRLPPFNHGRSPDLFSEEVARSSAELPARPSDATGCLPDVCTLARHRFLLEEGSLRPWPDLVARSQKPLAKWLPGGLWAHPEGIHPVHLGNVR